MGNAIPLSQIGALAAGKRMTDEIIERKLVWVFSKAEVIAIIVVIVEGHVLFSKIICHQCC